jgi:hypothetical protein
MFNRFLEITCVSHMLFTSRDKSCMETVVFIEIYYFVTQFFSFEVILRLK